MARLFWQGISEGTFPDGRRALNVLLRQKDTGDIHRWTPKWVEVAALAQGAHAVEVANEAESPYAPLLDGARATVDVARRRRLVKRILSVEAATKILSPCPLPTLQETTNHLLRIASQFEEWMDAGAISIGDLGNEPLSQVWCVECGWHLAHPVTCCAECKSPDAHLAAEG